MSHTKFTIIFISIQKFILFIFQSLILRDKEQDAWNGEEREICRLGHFLAKKPIVLNVNKFLSKSKAWWWCFFKKQITGKGDIAWFGDFLFGWLLLVELFWSVLGLLGGLKRFFMVFWKCF
jgi:hypothetical protein